MANIYLDSEASSASGEKHVRKNHDKDSGDVELKKIKEKAAWSYDKGNRYHNVEL